MSAASLAQRNEQLPPSTALQLRVSCGRRTREAELVT